MRKILVFTSLLILTLLNLNAQTRLLRKDEIDYMNSIYPVIYNAIPHEYKDWKAVGDKKEFDAIKFYCPVVYAENDCTGRCSVSLGKGDPYTIAYDIQFSMPEAQSSALMATAFKSITDFNNATQIASALKGNSKAKLSIRVIVNVSSGKIGSFLLSYCGKTKPTDLALPVPATLAVLGVHTDGCPFMNDGRPDMAPGDNYYDNAIVFLGKPVSSQEADDRHDGQVRTRYAIGFDHTKIGIPFTQNIVVLIKGDAADINAIVSQIDWKALNGLIEKK